MEVETREKENGTEIIIRADTEVAVVVEGDEERIYLPDSGSSDSTYYLEDSGGLSRTETGFRVFHSGEVEEVTVFSN